MDVCEMATRRLLLACASLVLLLPPARAAEPPPRKVLVNPGELLGTEKMLAERAKQQLATLDRFKAFSFFRFEDHLAESGIRFVHHVVDDAGKDYKAVHYDHGNGVAVADVDGDGLYDLYFTTQLGSNELWRNVGGGRFEDITARAGVGLADRVSVTAAFGDIDNDGDPDLFVTTVKMGNVLFENDGHGRFHDISKAAGVDYVGHSSGSVFFDYDLDGLLDLFVTNVGTYTTSRQGRGGYYIGVEQAFSGHLFPERTETSILYKNLGGKRFRDVSKETGLVDGSWSGDVTATDFDGDRYPDLYVLNMQGDDHYWRNEGGKRFIEETAQHFPKSPWGAMGVKFFDYDDDGRLDLILTDMHSDMTESIGPEREKLKSRMQWSDQQLQGGANNIFGNAFWHNLGGGKFEEISDRVGAEDYWPWGVSVGDLNADGYQDVFITASMNYAFRYGINTVLLNNLGDTFLDAEFILEVEPRKDGAYATDWFDLECGGADKGHRDCEGESGPVTVRAARGSRSSVIFDLDGDHDLDIVTNEFNAAPQVLVSDLAEQTEVHALEVKLVGKRSNRDGLGARVEVTAGGKTQVQYHDGSSGYLSHSLMPLYFGLGDAKKVDRVVVEWPSGVHQVLDRGIAVNTRLEVVEEAPGESPEKPMGKR